MSKLFDIADLDELLERHRASSEYKKRCEPFEMLEQKYITLQKKYMKSFQKFSDDVNDAVYRKEYARGGQTIHRGFYSPSSLDLVVGGCSRGKLLKRQPKNLSNSYEYLFDETGKMICTKKYCDKSEERDGVSRVDQIEFFVYESNKVISFGFHPHWNYAPEFITECQYNEGRLCRYESALCMVGDETFLIEDKEIVTEISVEEFGYTNDLLQTIMHYYYMPSSHDLSQEKYTLTRDQEGYLTSYIVDEIGGLYPELYPREYKIGGKRK